MPLLLFQLLKSFFITGTGTDVGKTVCSAMLAQAALNAGYRTAVMKPVQTGTDDYPPDLATIHEMVEGLTPLPEALATPYSFPLAASPHLAAREAGGRIEPETILNAFRDIESLDSVDLLLLEGAGGLMVPLTEEYLTVDLIEELAIPVIIVTLAGLGTINHTLLTISLLQQRNLEIAGLIVNQVPNQPEIIATDNLRTISKLTGVPVLATVPALEPASLNSLKCAEALLKECKTEALIPTLLDK